MNSDPAAELHKLATALQRVNSKERTSQVLATMLKVTDGSGELYVALGSVAARFDRLREIYDAALEEPQRSLALATLTGLRSFLNPNGLRAQWTNVAQQAFSAQNLQTLLMSSAFIRTVAPVCVPTEEERKQVASDLDDAISGLAEYQGALSVALRSSLMATKRILECFDIYGTDALAEELLRGFSLRSVDERESSVPAAERKARRRGWAVVAMVAGLIIGSDELLGALENHYNRAQYLLGVMVQEQKLLPAPDRPDDGTLPDQPEVPREPKPRPARSKKPQVV